MFHMGKIQETKHLKFSGYLWENAANILPQICTTAYIFTRPLLSYSAEESASWEHCPRSPARRPPWRPIRKMGEPRAMEGRDGSVEGTGYSWKVLYCILHSFKNMSP